MRSVFVLDLLDNKLDKRRRVMSIQIGVGYLLPNFAAQSCLWYLRCDRMKPQRKTRLRERRNDMFELFLVIVYCIVRLLRESYLEFVAAEYYCDQCRWMAESKRNGQLPEDRKYWEH